MVGRRRRTTRGQNRRPAARRRPAAPAARRWIGVAVVVLAALAAAMMLRPARTSQASPAAGSAPAPPLAGTGRPQAVRNLRVEVLRELAHERDAYTQGLVWWNGRLFESTGRTGESTLRRLDPRTGAVEQRIDTHPQYFGEGLALVDRRFIMLTWRAQRAYVYDRDSFEELDTFRYQGEGWGLCFDGERLVMSDGSDRLTFRDPVTFEPTGGQAVRMRGQPVYELNELECVDGAVYANVWEEDYIVRIDPADGVVTDYIDAAGLLQGADLIGAEVLNGIAYDPNADTFYITGKWWPKMFEVRFVE